MSAIFPLSRIFDKNCRTGLLKSESQAVNVGNRKSLRSSAVTAEQTGLASTGV